MGKWALSTRYWNDALSKEFSISINELISGEKIKDLDYKEQFW